MRSPAAPGKIDGPEEFQNCDSKFRHMMEALPVAIHYSSGNEQGADYINSRFLKLFGYVPDEIPTLSQWEQLAYPDEKYRHEIMNTWHARVRKAMETKQDIEPLEAVVTCKDGSKKNILFTYSISEAGNISCALDLTVHRKAEKALLESEERYELALRATHDGIWDWNIVTGEEYFSPRWREIMGYSPDDPDLLYPTESWKARIHPDDLDRVIRQRNSMTPENNNYYAEYRLRNKTGEYIWLRSTGKALFDETGQPVRIVGSLLDITDRKKTELALQEREEALNLAQELSKSGSWELDLKTLRLSGSKNYRKMLSISEDAGLTTRYFMERVHPDDVWMVNSKLSELLTSKKPVSYDIRVRLQDNAYHWLQNNIFPVVEGDEVVLLRGVNIDVSSQKASEEEIRRQNKRLNAIISAVPDLIFVIDKEGNYLEFFTAEPEKLLIKPSEIIGNNLKNAFSEEMSAQFMLKIHEVITTGRLNSVDYAITLPESESTHFEARIAPLDKEKVLIIARDVTQNARKDFQIRKLSLAVEQSPVCIVITDLDAVIEYVNPAYITTTGYAEDELIGFNANKLYSGETDPAVFEDLWRTITSGRPWQGEWVNRKKDGTLYWDSVLITPIHNDQGEVINYLGLQQDITGRKKAEEELIAAKEKAEESDMLKTAFLNNMSHEVRTPLNAIMGFSELLPAADKKNQEYFASIIRKSSDQLLSFFEDTLYLSRLQSEKLPVNPSEFSPGELLVEVSQMFNMSVENDQVKLEISVPESLASVRVRADEAKIRQVLTHLTSNAVKYTRQGRIEIGYSIQGNSLEFYVSDTGIGISKGEQERIFDNFYRGKKPVKDAIRGTGVGLNISRELVSMMGGAIRVVSEPGKGSRFSFDVPFEQLEGQMAADLSQPARKAMKELHVLIAEDELINFRLIEFMIKNKVLQIDHAFNGEEAVRMAKENSYDLVLMDIHMPKMGGFEATRIIKELVPAPIVIAHSAYSHPEDRTRAQEAGCDDFIDKPSRKDNILEIISRYFVPAE